MNIIINNATWASIDPMSKPIADYVIGTGRPISQNKIERIRRSINEIGLVTKSVHAVETPDGKIEIIDERALWMALDGWYGSGDPRQYLGVLLAPEGTNVPETCVLLNRAQQQYALRQAIIRWANAGLPEYVHLRNLIDLYPFVSPGYIAICLCTRFDSVRGGLTQELEEGRFVANNTVRGELCIEFLNQLFADLNNQRRFEKLHADGFIARTRDRWANGTFLVDYTGAPGRTRRVPGTPNASLILPQPTAPQPRVTARGFIRYTLIHDQVVQDDINFPRIPYNTGRGNRNAWFDSVLDNMGIPRP